jgi:hypothetical protein
MRKGVKQINSYRISKNEYEVVISEKSNNIIEKVEQVKETVHCIVKREHSAKEIRDKNNLRKQKQIAALKEKYGEAAYKEMKAKQMADYRNKKKENIEEDV